MIDSRGLEEVDPVLGELVAREVARQNTKIQLIASENSVPIAVLEAMGSVFTNKYSEGYPGRRYYEGCVIVDEVESLAIERAKSLFGAAAANVQAHSGSQANMAAYLAVLEPGDTILGMRLDQGGHLTHGSPVNFSGKLFDFVAYGLDSAQAESPQRPLHADPTEIIQNIRPVPTREVGMRRSALPHLPPDPHLSDRPVIAHHYGRKQRLPDIARARGALGDAGGRG